MIMIKNVKDYYNSKNDNKRTMFSVDLYYLSQKSSCHPHMENRDNNGQKRPGLLLQYLFLRGETVSQATRQTNMRIMGPMDVCVFLAENN